MGFCDLLDRIVALLQRRGRVTYRALRREFNLDDALLDDLKAELIEAQQLARDENGRVLVWSGETEIGTETSSSTTAPSAPQTNNAR